MILLKFKTEIKGDSKLSQHEGWITLQSINFSTSRPLTAHSGGTDRDTSTPMFTDIACTKETDVASTELFMQSVCGKSLGEATLHFMQTSGDKGDQVYLTVTLAEPIVTSFNFGAGSDMRGSETFTLNFTKMKMKYTSFDGDKKTEGSEKGWDLTIGKAW
ncbi:MAG: type VI secretion system tube protein Hcp [Pirellulales bacterium]